MSASKPEPDCTSQCRSTAHGDAITAALSVGGASEEALAAYLRATCANYCQVTDGAGRTALHMAATFGHDRVAQWLARHRECKVNARDGENGFTALHRSVFYGHIAVAVNLIQLGASATAVDGDELTAVETAVVDRPAAVELSVRGPCEVYVWGTNANYTLGTGNQQVRHSPELLEVFRKQGVSIKQVAMHKFHTVFVSHSGTAYSCGHGQGGRLGLGTEQATVLMPRAIGLGDPCVAASVSRDHTVLLGESGLVYVCGLNQHHQLGLSPPPPSLTTPTPLPQRAIKAGAVVGVCAARFHTVVWGAKTVWTFGLHAGQLGHPKSADKTIVKPKAVAAIHLKESVISQVATSDSAVVVVTDKGHIFLLHEYECRRIATRQTEVAKVAVVGGQLDVRGDKEALSDHGGSALIVLVLTTRGRLLLWREDLPQFTRCQFTPSRLLTVRDVAMTPTQVLIVTRDGEAFTGEVKPRKTKKATLEQSPKTATVSRHLERADCEVIRVSKLPHVHRAVSIAADVKGRNYAVLQTHPKLALFEVPQLGSTSQMRDNMKTLLDEADAVHDVVFQIGSRKFPAHQYIIKSRNEYLGALISKQAAVTPGRMVTVQLDRVEPAGFQQILQYIYTNQCDLMTNAKSDDTGTIDVSGNRSAFAVYSEQRKDKRDNATDPVVVVRRLAKTFDMADLSAELRGFDDGLKSRHRASAPQPRWRREAHPELLDVVILSENGRELRAHKCILTSRLQYFHSMFLQGWSEARDVVKLAVPHNILEILVDFLYEDDVAASVEDSDDLDLLSSLLVVADQMFVTRLKEQCEVSLVNVLTLRSAAELLQLADTYMAEQLKRCCMQYVCFNLSAVLEARSLEGLSPKLLRELSTYYRSLNPTVHKRVVAPYFFSPSVETLLAALEVNPFTFESHVMPTAPGDVARRSKKKPRAVRVVDGARGRKESTSSVASDDAQATGVDEIVGKPCVEESHKENIAQWVKIPTSKQQKILQARLKAISASKETSFIEESSRESFTLLSRNSPSPVLSSPMPTTSPEPRILAVRTAPQEPPPPPAPSDFPDLCSAPSNGHHKSAPRHIDAKKLSAKLSQKERKRLSSLNDVALMGDHLDTINRPPPTPAWGRPNPDTDTGSCSLVDIIRQELKQVRMSPSRDVEPPPRKEPDQPAKMVATNPWSKMAATNPWSKMAAGEAVAVKPEMAAVINFSDIVAHEQKGKDNLTKMLAKPLELTQIEDRAIKDLLLFYNAAGATDERITVRRFSRGPVAVPTWVANH